MALQININGTIVPNGGFYQMDEWVIYNSSPAYPRETVTVTNTGANSFTITGVVKSSWSRNIDISGIAVPVTLAPGEFVTGVLRVTRRGPLDEGTYFPGCPFGQSTFYTTTGNFSVELAAKMKRETATSGYSFPSTGEFVRDWVIDGWALSNAGQTNQNPLQFNWNILNSGHYQFALNYLRPTLDAGHKAIMLWAPWGQTQNLNPNDAGNIQFDAYIHAQEYAQNSGNNNVWIDWTRCLDYIFTYPDVEVYVYNGTMRSDSHFYNIINSGTPEDFYARCARSVSHLLRYDLNICFDANSNYTVTGVLNPLCQPGEPRYEFINLCRKLLARKNKRVYLEPRAQADEPYWFGASGWNHLMLDLAYIRANPDWYQDANESATDEQCSGIIRWMSDGSINLIPYQIADTFMYNQRIIASIGNLWYRLGGKTVEELYLAVKNLSDYCNGGVSP